LHGKGGLQEHHCGGGKHVSIDLMGASVEVMEGHLVDQTGIVIEERGLQ